MKQKHGFTLIELLAVIVILAIVALVATPIILDVINSSKEKARLSSVYGIMDAARLYSIQKQYEGIPVSHDNLINELVIEGEKPEIGDVRVNDLGTVALALKLDNNCYLKGYNTSSVITNEYDEDTCILPLTIADLIETEVTSGDGLYLDNLDSSYRYKGSNPNNYIRLFDGEDGIYRIIAIEGQGVKVMSNNMTNISWDTGFVPLSDCNSATCPRYNNGNTYCDNAYTPYDNIDTYMGCNAYRSTSDPYTNGPLATGIVNDNSNMYNALNQYYNDYLASLNGIIIQNATFNVGGVTTGTLENLMDYEDSDVISSKIGLMNTSDYVRSQLPSINANCVNEIYNTRDCKNSNWIYSSERFQWTFNAVVNNNYYVWVIDSNNGNLGNDYAFSAHGTRPVAYLTFNIDLQGLGTIDNPYTIIH